MAGQKVGRVVQVIGPVLDVEFPEGHLPPIYNAVVVKEEASKAGVAIDVIAEVAQHLGENRVRCISDRKSTRLNSSHLGISYAVFCLKKKKGKHHCCCSR